MQKKLTQTLVAVALLAVLLVGAGVLLLSTLGARDQARSLVEQQLIAVANIANNTSDRARAGTALGQVAEAFDLRSVSIVVLARDGRVFEIEPPDRRERNRQDDQRQPGRNIVARLDENQQQEFASGESIMIDEAGSVIGLRLVDLEIDERPGGDEVEQAVGVLVRRDIDALGGNATRWFLASGALVVLASVAAASWLARRFTAPIKQVTAATADIATGDLTTRVEVDTNDELGDLGRSVNRMAAELERGQALEQQFLLSVSHDLRTPLTAISGYAEALTDGAVEDPVRAGEVIHQHAGRLNRLVGDLLDLARLEARQFRLELRPCDVRRVADRAVDGLLPTAAGHDLTLHHDAADLDLPMITADPDRLGQVLANLIENAIKFAESTVTLRTSSANGEVRIDVIDDGPGIPAPDVPHVFERLYVTQLQPIRAESSSGLGLAIVRELTSAMGGTVAASAGDTGTVMTLRFPRAD